jgi:hypothetical protein
MSLNEAAQAELIDDPTKVKCKHCSATPRLAHKILDVRSGGTLRMYKCACGEQMWVKLVA